MIYKYQLHSKYTKFKKDLLNIQEIFKNSDKSIHKARNELKIVEINGLKCVVKSFKIPHVINRIAYTFFRDGKAKKSFINATKLVHLNINTPNPIGIIEFYSYGLIKESYFISLYEPYDFTIREVFHHKVANTESILQAFSKFTYDIHQKGIWHIDYSLGNILISKIGNKYKFSLVDINRMQFKKIDAKEGLKNFNKFWAKDKNDLNIIAKEYAKLSRFDEKEAIFIIQQTATDLELKVNLKRRVKNGFKN